MPTTKAVVELIENLVVPEHSEVTTLTGDEVNLSTEDMKKATVIEVEDPATGNNVKVNVIEDPSGNTTDSSTDSSADSEPIADPEVVEPIADPELDEPIADPELDEPIADPEVVEPIADPELDEPVIEPKKVEVYETTVEDIPTGMTVEEILEGADGKPVVLDFQFDACKPCQTLAEPYEAMMKDNEDIVFYKVDLMDKANEALIRSAKVKAAPTFIVWDKDGNQTETFEGVHALEPL